MTSRTRMRKEILAVQAEANALLQGDPANDRLQFVVGELGRLAELVEFNWPFTEVEKGTVIVGVYAVREVEDSYPDLAVRLTHIAYDLKHG